MRTRSAWPARPASVRAGRRAVVALGLAAALLVAGGCRSDMHDQPRYEPMEQSRFFADGRAARPLVPGTVARGRLHEDVALHQGRGADGGMLARVPLALSPALLARGRERYDIYCSPCHDRVGNGRGMIVQRGFKAPSSFHLDRMRALPDGYYFQVVTNGFGTMPSYAAQIPVEDRWAIVAYVRALQLSQHATLADVPVEARAELDRRAAAGGARSAGQPAHGAPRIEPQGAEAHREGFDHE